MVVFLFVIFLHIFAYFEQNEYFYTFRLQKHKKCMFYSIFHYNSFYRSTKTDNFNSIKSVLLSLDENTAKSIKNAIALFENRTIQNDLAYIKSNFGFITQSILKFIRKCITFTR